MQVTQYIAKTIFGLEHLLADEIESLGGVNISILNRAVSFEGTIETLYKVNLHARTALRVLKPFLEFRAHNETVLYKRLRRYDWTKLIALDQTFKINSVVNSDKFTHSKYISLKTKDAIVDLFRLKHDGQRPSIDIYDPDFTIDVYCRGMNFIISLDSSGDSLHKRGYRQGDRPAPINEALAAGMIMHTKWKGDTPLLDPMCGSGTILIEALMIASNIAPRINRKHFQFMNWKDYDVGLWNKIRKLAIDAQDFKKLKIYGIEKSIKMYQETSKLIEELGYDSIIKLSSADFFEAPAPAEEGVIITNPPYGIRLQPEEMNNFYKKIGDTLKQKYNGWSAWIISGNKDALKFLGLRTSKKLTLYNGQIECKFHNYQLYQGSKKKITSQLDN